MPKQPHPSNRKSIIGQQGLFSDEFPVVFYFYCRRCGCLLKSQKSIDLGVGPTCLKKLNRSQIHDDYGHQSEKDVH